MTIEQTMQEGMTLTDIIDGKTQNIGAQTGVFSPSLQIS